MTAPGVERIERVAATAWPTNERTSLGDWILSAGDGFSRRRNSTVPCGPPPDDLERRLSDVESWYTVRGSTPLYRITPMCDPSIDGILEDRGYRIESPVVVMTRPLEAVEPAAGIESSPVATEAWVSAELEALGVDRRLVGQWLATIAVVPPPVSFVTAVGGTETVGAGFGYVGDGLLGAFEIAVRPEYRRRGHARRLMDALHRFGVEQGADDAFLQVAEDNTPAIALYEAIGYRPAYRYWYRRADA